MCGITGIIASQAVPGTREKLEAMTAAVRHRGPDAGQTWVNPGQQAWLGHRRLAILDLSASASQPMHLDQRYTIVHNGEIYNYLELKSTLQQKGYQFTNQSDTEVILAAYACYGSSCTQHLDGMFAFAIWDNQQQVLFAARDRLGEKPFYYCLFEDQFYFASELKALWAAGLPRETDPSLLLHFLTTGSAALPLDLGRSYYKTIRKLPPAHQLEYRPGGQPSLQQYWKIDADAKFSGTAEQAANQFGELFQRAIQLQLRSDVAIGTSLSGGLDSSSVVAAISQLADGNTAWQQKTFTCSFPGFEKDESDYAKTVAHQFRLKQFTTTPDAADLARELPQFAQQLDLPMSSASVYAQYKVFELAKQQGITVLLDGQGADETLAGYSKYRHWFLQELLATGNRKQFLLEKAAFRQLGQATDWSFQNYIAAFFPAATAKLLQRKVLNGIRNNTWLNPEFVREYLLAETSFKPRIAALNQLLYFNTFHSGLDELLRYADSNSMAHGCELRLPFLQKDLIQFSFSLPATYKIKQGFSKWVLRQSMQQWLPASIAWRAGKTGFEPPQKMWMGNKKMDELFQNSLQKLVKAGVLQPAILQKKIQPHEAYAADSNDWRYLSAGLLLPA